MFKTNTSKTIKTNAKYFKTNTTLTEKQTPNVKNKYVKDRKTNDKCSKRKRKPPKNRR